MRVNGSDQGFDVEGIVVVKGGGHDLKGLGSLVEVGAETAWKKEGEN